MSDETADRLAIQELIATYNDAVMRMDADAWGSTWADDGVWSSFSIRRSHRDFVKLVGALLECPLQVGVGLAEAVE